MTKAATHKKKEVILISGFRRLGSVIRDIMTASGRHGRKKKLRAHILAATVKQRG